jgi:hypothetical protein
VSVRLVSLAVLVLALAAAPACASQLRAPPRAAQPDSAFAVVPYPPPAAHAQVVPASPSDDASWVDGQWVWVGVWTWVAGGWVVLAHGERFAPWETRRAPNGSLLFAPSSWRDDAGREIAPPPFVEAPP